MKKYFKLLRIKHYIKNLLILIPLFFGKELLDRERLGAGILGVCSFCMASSAVYILNDLRDIEKDRNHPAKKNRPLASGAVSRKTAVFLIGCCMMLSVLLVAATNKIGGGIFCRGLFSPEYSVQLRIEKPADC